MSQDRKVNTIFSSLIQDLSDKRYRKSAILFLQNGMTQNGIYHECVNNATQPVPQSNMPL